MGKSCQTLNITMQVEKRSAPIINPKMTGWAWVLVMVSILTQPPLRMKNEIIEITFDHRD